MKLKNSIFYIAIVFLILAFAEFIPQLLTFRFMGQNILNQRVWINLLFIFAFVTQSKRMFSKSLMWLYAYFAIYLLLEIVGHYRLSGFGEGGRYFWFRDQHFAFGVSILLAELFIRDDKLDELRFLIKLSFVVIVMMSLYNSILIFRNPGLVRGTEYKLLGDELSHFRRMGLSSYVFFSSLPFIVPSLVFRYKNMMGKDTFSALLSFVSIVIVMLCSYFAVIVAPFLLGLVLLFLALVGRRRFRANLSIIFMVLVIVVLIPNSVKANLLYDIAASVPNRDLSYKMNEIGQTLEYGFDLVTYDDEASTSIEGRASRIRYNLRDFLLSPIIGTGKESNGHIYWLNLLAQFGIIGIIPLIMMIILQTKRMTGAILPETKFTYALTIMSFLMLGFMKAVAGYSMFLIPFFVVPGALFLYNRQ